jgi:MFS family permease
LAQAPDVFVLGIGWMLAQIGWGATVQLLAASQADRLSPDQRGRVSGLGGVVSQLAPVIGVLIGGQLAGNNLLLFLVPGAVGVVALTVFVCFVSEPDNRDAARAAEPLTVRTIVRSYAFSPRRHSDFAWNWLGKFLFMFGLIFNTTFASFFLAERMHVSVAAVANTIAGLAGGSIVTAILGAIGGGFLSDRLRRRRVFALVGACVFGAGTVIAALSPSVPAIIGGIVLGNFGLGAFSSVDQAIMLDVLPERDTDAGRYTAIYGLANSVPQGFAPLIAPVFLAIGASGAAANYTLLYLVAAGLSLAGGLAVTFKVKSVR